MVAVAERGKPNDLMWFCCILKFVFLGSCFEFWGPILGPVFGPSFGAFLFGFVKFGAGEVSSFGAVRNQPGGQFLDQ